MTMLHHSVGQEHLYTGKSHTAQSIRRHCCLFFSAYESAAFNLCAAFFDFCQMLFSRSRSNGQTLDSQDAKRITFGALENRHNPLQFRVCAHQNCQPMPMLRQNSRDFGSQQTNLEKHHPKIVERDRTAYFHGKSCRNRPSRVDKQH